MEFTVAQRPPGCLHATVRNERKPAAFPACCPNSTPTRWRSGCYAVRPWGRIRSALDLPETSVPKPNYQFAKRQKEIAKKQKKEEKRQKKSEPGAVEDRDDASPTPADDKPAD